MSAVIAPTHTDWIQTSLALCRKCPRGLTGNMKRGLCGGCYQKERAASMPQAECHPERKEHCARLCRSCYRDGGRAKRAKCHPDRFQAAHGLCRKCYNDLPANKEKAIRVRRLRKYGLSEAEYDALLKAQGWRCAICGGKPEAVDHDHGTGAVRGILCRTCNAGLGHFKDSPQLLIEAATYLSGGVQ